MEDVNCIFCGIAGDTYKAGKIHLNLVDPFSVKKCPQCGLLFLSPRPSQKEMQLFFNGQIDEALQPYADKIPNYTDVSDTRRKYFSDRVHMLRRQCEHLAYKSSSLKILDIGASNGVFLEEAIKVGFDAYGIEPGKSGWQACIDKGLNVKNECAEKLPFPDNYFDAIHSNHVFEHLQNPLLAIKEIYRVLRPNGIVLIEVPNQFRNIQFFRDEFFDRIPVRERNIRSIHHFYFFSKNTLKRLFKEAGFSNIVVSSYYGKPRSGLGRLGSYAMRFMGLFFLGGPFLIGNARKSE